MDIGFVGLGRMGSAMARNIAKGGHRVHAWNRSPVDAASHPGIDIVATPQTAFQADAVFTMLADDRAIRDVLLAPGILATARPGLVHVVTSTISVDFVAELCAQHNRAGIAYVASPVFGRPDVAEQGALNIVVAGDAQAIDRVQPLLDLVGKKTWRMGENPQQANAAKIAGNMMIALAIEAMAEAAVIAGSHHVAPDEFLKLMAQTLFGGRVYEGYGAKIAAGDVTPGFQMRLGLKDLGLAMEIAETSGKRLPLLQAVHARMKEAVESGRGDQDWSAIAAYTMQS